MSEQLLLAVDAGTSVIKAVAFDTAGNQVASKSRRNTYKTLANGGAEQDMRRTWEDCAAVLRALADDVPDLASRVICLGVTGQGDGTWLIDGDGEPVHDGWLWLDGRAGEEAQNVLESEGLRTVYRGTATGVNVCQMRIQLHWMLAHAPELLARSATAFHCKDWLYFRLTGMRTTDPSEGIFNFGDFRTRQYSEDVITALGLGDLRHLIPPMTDGVVTAHPLSAQAARETGLPQGLPVSLGYVDVMCTAIAAGLYDAAVRPGFSILGSTGMHMRFVSEATDVVLNEAASGYTMPFPGQAYAQMQTNMAATVNLDWLLGVGIELLQAEGLSKTLPDLLNGLDEKVLSARPGAALFHPYILPAGERGPFTDPQARASFTNLDQNTGWFDLVRGVFDGLMLASRDCYTAMGPIPSEIRVGGGGARSDAIRALLASALDRPVRRVDQDEAGAAGAAMIAAVQCGLFSSIGAASDAWVTPLLRDPVFPDHQLVATYDTLFDAYLATRRALPPVWQNQTIMRGALQ
ncbi:MAG: FGGY-family carbohydrate kinase [Pseudomonadota bacterium]